jgi:hypothetical protein
MFLRRLVSIVINMQGDQIGRIFSNWTIVYTLDIFLEITVVDQILACLFPR